MSMFGARSREALGLNQSTPEPMAPPQQPVAGGVDLSGYNTTPLFMGAPEQRDFGAKDAYGAAPIDLGTMVNTGQVPQRNLDFERTSDPWSQLNKAVHTYPKGSTISIPKSAGQFNIADPRAFLGSKMNGSFDPYSSSGVEAIHSPLIQQSQFRGQENPDNGVRPGVRPTMNAVQQARQGTPASAGLAGTDPRDAVLNQYPRR